MSTKLEIAKKVIIDNIELDCGIFNTPNLCGDFTSKLYCEDGLIIQACYGYGYFEVFGLSDSDFAELKEYYIEQTRKEGKKCTTKKDFFTLILSLLATNS